MKILIQWHEAFRWFLVLALSGYAIWAWNAEAGDATVQPPSMTGDFENLRSELETQGWRVERTPDGSTLLFPILNTAQEPEPASITLTVSPEDMQQLRELLDGYSWNLVQEGNNALRLAAPAQPHALATATKADCAEAQQEFLFTAGITLPVNTDEEAWLISANWLWASGYTELEVGNIRDINWTYIVQIVDQIPPYRVRNELIINKQSGRLLVLY